MPQMNEYDTTKMPVQIHNGKPSSEEVQDLTEKVTRKRGHKAPAEAHRQSKNKKYLRKIERQKALVRVRGHNKRANKRSDGHLY